MDNLEFGKRGEAAAKAFLKREGFTILHCNWRCGHKELDIVAESANALHIVEVKTRQPNSLIEPQTSVTMQKQRLTIFAAHAYVKIFKVTKNVQFDIISVVANAVTNKCKIEYLPQAFYPVVK